MSQIGYMVMGVCARRYAAGLFHLMTHAFFKALLFMAAGSVIARDGRHAGPRPDGRLPARRCRSPTAASIVGGLALAGVSPFSGLSPRTRSSPEFERGGWHVVLGVLGYIGSFVTAIYTFRMIFRAFYGEPGPRRESSSSGHLHHARRPTQPGHGRGGGHRRRLPRPRAPHRRARVADEGRRWACWPSARSASARCRSRA